MTNALLGPVPTIKGRRAYRVPRPLGPIDLKLDGNEGPAPAASLLDHVKLTPELLRRYPKTNGLRDAIAQRHNIAPEQVLVTAGADDALARACTALLCPGRELVLPEPTFEMIRRYAEVTGGTIVSVPWPTPEYPLAAVLQATTHAAAMIAMVSPNNPTGATATAEQLAQLSHAAPHAVIMLDHAYVELADEDLSAQALGLPNVLVFRTLSKAWGMAGLRIGYVMGPAEVIDWLRRSGNPYPVSAVSLALAQAQYADDAGVVRYRQVVRKEREVLHQQLLEADIDARPSQANFVYAQGPRVGWLRDGLASLGIAVRGWGEGPLQQSLRITCPGGDAALQRLCHALHSAANPQALLLDMDGVMVDVSRSYREAILQTAQSYGVTLSLEDIAAAKAAGDANNDWQLTWRLLQSAGVSCSLAEVTDRFEDRYQGRNGHDGLRLRETPLVSRQWLEKMAVRMPLAVVTGRPRADAQRYLESQQLSCFSALVCMEDAALKPSPEPVTLALSQLGVRRAWMVGDTPDDIVAAARAGVVSLGIAAADDDSAAAALSRAGAARILTQLDQLEELLP